MTIERLDRRIFVYRIDGGKDAEGKATRIRHYLNPDACSPFRAAFRDLSAKEAVQDREVGLDSTAVFTMARRPISNDCYIEVRLLEGRTRTFRVTAIDGYDWKTRTRIRVKAVEVEPERFDDTKWGNAG